MANEITARAALLINKNGVIASNDITVQSTLAGIAIFENVQNVTTAAAAVNFGSLGSANLVLFKNLDPANYVQIALDSGVSTQIFAKLLPGGIALFPLQTLTIYAKANTAAVNLFVQAVEQ